MQEKVNVKLLAGILSSLLLSVPFSLQCTIAYIPQALRECIAIAWEVAEESSDAKNLQELDMMIKENRILASEDMAREAVREAIDAVRIYKDEFKSNDQRKVIEEYLKSIFID